MKKEYKILVPNMLPMHFRLIMRVLKNYGYDMELLESEGKHLAEKGLRYVHNDTCYPAILVIGQFLDAIESGKYDPHKVALILFQTGGGCRASNYVSLLRKALSKAGYGYVPVIAFSFGEIEKHSGWKITIPIYLEIFHALLYADLLMNLRNQCEVYEASKGASALVCEKWVAKLTSGDNHLRMPTKKESARTYREIIDDFAKIELNRGQRLKVGIVGEIFVKYSPLGNNNLADFLVKNGAEPVIPGFVDFILYCIYNVVLDKKLYGFKSLVYTVYEIIYNVVLKKQKAMIEAIKEEGTFDAPTPFDVTLTLAKGIISFGAKMGEGWLLTSEMVELYHSNAKNIVCTQPFGCLPNHICGKGMMKPLKEKYPDINIVAIDYDAGATAVNQENRIRLMLSNARLALESEAEAESESEAKKESASGEAEKASV
ncbi:MAG: 2-hydroxyacyl-CoA dehydratase [Clostridia bacterium]|nr:2-hydroxyacyl-CoA dehydratase [Clostridia bacterium]